jgi:hypothetical protein
MRVRSKQLLLLLLLLLLLFLLPAQIILHTQHLCSSEFIVTRLHATAADRPAWPLAQL